MSCGEKGCCCRHDDRAVYILSLCHSLSVGHIEVCVYGSCLVQCADAATAAAAAVVLSVCVLVMLLVRLYFSPFELNCGLMVKCAVCEREGEERRGEEMTGEGVSSLSDAVAALPLCLHARPSTMPHTDRSVHPPTSHSLVHSFAHKHT
uniref:Uncharacterized protein n=1 Tax=Vitrella brassicaformis TaxID=1169539 RepID=A0A7S1KFP0_9ALVE